MATKVDWPAAIGRHVLVQQQIRALDAEHIWGHELPALGASVEALARAESQLGSLPPQLHDFLVCADGWRAFYQWLDLFGTNELTTSVRTRIEQDINALRARGCFSELSADWHRILVLGATREVKRHAHLGADVFVIVRAGPRAGKSYWLGGEEVVDEFPDFYHLFASMTAYLEDEVARLVVDRRRDGR